MEMDVRLVCVKDEVKHAMKLNIESILKKNIAIKILKFVFSKVKQKMI